MSFHTITGNMFSGKSKMLTGLITEQEKEGHPWLAVKPIHDTRPSRYWWEDRAVKVTSPDHLKTILSTKPERVFGDEVQFFHPVCAEILATAAITRPMEIVVAGLNLDWLGRPWPTMAAMLCYADQVTTLSAICGWCGGEATRSHRISGHSGLVIPGGAELYQPACGRCWLKEHARLTSFKGEASSVVPPTRGAANDRNSNRPD
jgi:thymidine kinase